MTEKSVRTTIVGLVVLAALTGCNNGPMRTPVTQTAIVPSAVIVR